MEKNKNGARYERFNIWSSIKDSFYYYSFEIINVLDIIGKNSDYAPQKVKKAGA